MKFQTHKRTIETRYGHYVVKIDKRRRRKNEVPPHMIFKLKEDERKNSVFHDHLYIRPDLDGALYGQRDVFEAVDTLASVFALKLSQNSSLDYLLDSENPEWRKWSFGFTLLSSHLLGNKITIEQQIPERTKDSSNNLEGSRLDSSNEHSKLSELPTLERTEICNFYNDDLKNIRNYILLELQGLDKCNSQEEHLAVQEITGGKVKNAKNLSELMTSRKPENLSFIEVPKIEVLSTRRKTEKFEEFVGHIFSSRRELSSVGIHIRIKQSIEYDENCAYSLVLHGTDLCKDKMRFSRDKGKAFVYCGQSLSVLSATGTKMVAGVKKKRRIYERKQSQNMNLGNLALMKNYINEIPVHVIRSYNLCASAYAPPLGYRYDGLYYIESVWSKVKKGCKEFRFKCKRAPGQLKSELYKRMVRAPLTKADDLSNSDESEMSEFSSSSEED